jgi:hypothetical protein
MISVNCEVPLNPDSFTQWNANDDDCALHNRDILDATKRLVFDVIPNLANFLDSQTSSYYLDNLPQTLHRRGINVGNGNSI